MQIYPAIDLRHKRIVRLYQGNFQQETVYHTHPIAFAQQLQDAGVTWLHMVDLDAAQNPAAHQRDYIAQLVQSTHIHVQVGGGIRTRADADALFAAGVQRIVVGSLALRDPETVRTWLSTYGPERLVLAFDVYKASTSSPMIAMQGWQTQSTWTLWDAIDYFCPANFRYLLCTDIQRDGTLHGPNLALYHAIRARYPALHLQASGGIRSTMDLIALRTKGIAGAIVGKALYEKHLTIQEAINLTC